MRKFTRHPTCVPIDITVEEPPLRVVESTDYPEPAEIMSSGTLLNISAGGLVLELFHPVEVSARLGISIKVFPTFSKHRRAVSHRRAGGQWGKAAFRFLSATHRCLSSR